MAQYLSEEFVVRAIEQAIRARITDILPKEIEAAQQRVKAQVEREIDQIALSVIQRYSMERDGSDLVIRVTKALTA